MKGKRVSDLIASRTPASAKLVKNISQANSWNFVLSAPILAIAYDAGFVAIRKIGKLPAEVYQKIYNNEYEKTAIEIQRDAFYFGSRVLIVDDVTATGGTALAAIELVREAGGTVVGFFSLIDIPELGGSQQINDAGVRFLTLYEHKLGQYE